MTTTLDPFQTALLAELRAVIGDRASAPVRQRRPFLVAAGVAVAGLATLVGVEVLQPQPAFAVTTGGGAVDVKVDRLEDAAGLERALEQAGVRADVRYLPAGRVCADGRYRAATAPDASADFRFSVGGDGYSVHLDPGAVGSDQTLVVSASRNAGHGVDVSIGVADGPVGACRVVTAPAP